MRNTGKKLAFVWLVFNVSAPVSVDLHCWAPAVTSPGLLIESARTPPAPQSSSGNHAEPLKETKMKNEMQTLQLCNVKSTEKRWVLEFREWSPDVTRCCRRPVIWAAPAPLHAFGFAPETSGLCPLLRPAELAPGLKRSEQRSQEALKKTSCVIFWVTWNQTS